MLFGEKHATERQKANSIWLKFCMQKTRLNNMMTLFVCLYLSPFNLTLQQKTGTHDTLGGLAVGTVQDQEDDTIKVQQT